MSDKTKPPVSEVYDQALKNYEQTLRTGLKLQEEAGRCWTNLLNQAGSAQDLQKRVTTMTNDIIPPAQKRMEEYLELIEQNNRSNVELFKKAVDAAQTTAPAEAQGKWVELMEASLKSVQGNAQAVTQIGSKMVDSWIGFVKKNAPEFAEPVGAKA